MARRKKDNTETEVVETAEAATASSPQEGQAQPGGLTVVDIRNAVNVIDFACTQGAFKGWDTITQVMSVRNKLQAFVDAVAPQIAEANKAAETAEKPAEPQNASE